ncbi:MAG: ATP-dependent Clp protease proteolytic subunit [Planctomycetes bacterium]|nr:ATP-dependent Clp protease proteolytic subunit [Planctomycetota bacterium]
MTYDLNRQHVFDCGKEESDKHGGAFIEKKLLENRTILVSSVVNRELMEYTVSRLLLLEAKDPKAMITVFVNSPGGDADSGFAIYDAMKFITCPVRTICSGLCASAGVIIYLGSDPGERLCLPNSRFLIHQPSVQAQGQASDLEITAQQIIKIRERYNAIVAQETGNKASQILKDANRDFWLTAQEAHDYKLVDKIIASRKDIL